MKRAFWFNVIFLCLFIFIISCSLSSNAQKITAAYVKALYQKYPAIKSAACSSCKLWINPYFSSIADTAHHFPLVTFYIYTKQHRLVQEALNLPRKGAYSSWHHVTGQPEETRVYTKANHEINRPHSAYMIAKGHCQAWILLAWCVDAALLSDTYTFNAGMEYQGQNTGTEEATENECRELTGWHSPGITDSVMIWCGTSGIRQMYSGNNISVSVPAYYYKIMLYSENTTRKKIMKCYWMPNQPAESRDSLSHRIITHTALIKHLGFDPMKLLPEKQ